MKKVLQNIGAVVLCIISLPFAIAGGAIAGVFYALALIIQLPVIVIQSIWEERHHE